MGASSDRATTSLGRLISPVFGSRDILREIELIEQPKQLAARGPDSRHLVGAGEFCRKFLLPENEDFKFSYGVHWVSFAFIRGARFSALPRSSPESFLCSADTGCHRFRIYLDEGALAASHHFDRRPGILCSNVIDRRLEHVAIQHLEPAAEEAGNRTATRHECSVVRALFRALQSHDEQRISPE
jgi:hypothetical protein